MTNVFDYSAKENNPEIYQTIDYPVSLVGSADTPPKPAKHAIIN